MADDEGTFSIRLVNADGDPLSDRRVTVFYSGLMGGVKSQQTDDDGWCEFSTYGHSRTDKIYSYSLQGVLISEHDELLSDGEEIYDGASFSFTIIDGSE